MRFSFPRGGMQRPVGALKQIEVPCIGRHPGMACVTPLGRENDWYFIPVSTGDDMRRLVEARKQSIFRNLPLSPEEI